MEIPKDGEKRHLRLAYFSMRLKINFFLYVEREGFGEEEWAVELAVEGGWGREGVPALSLPLTREKCVTVALLWISLGG